MGFIGSLFGGAVGLALGGPLGMVLGAALGHGLSGGIGTGRLGDFGRVGGTQRAQATYFISVFSMLAKMARADGTVSEQEIHVVESFMQRELALDADSQRAAIKIFRAAKDSPIRFEEFAGQFYEVFAADHEVLISMLDLLTRLAMADGHMAPGERQILGMAAQIFHIPAGEAAHIFARYGANSADAGARGSEQYRSSAGRRSSAAPAAARSYDVLGVDPSASDAEIKSRYRKLVAENHPDKIMAKGLPEEFVKFAEQRFREIQSAYESIKAERGIA